MAETAQQLETRLANVRAAIDRVMQMQSYSLAGRQVTHANLNQLMQLEKELQRKLARVSGSGPIVISDVSDLDSDNISGRF
jgi:transketolase